MTKQLIVRKGRPFNKDLFSEKELSILKQIGEKLKDISVKDIVELSHKEIAWKTNNANRELISYQLSAEILSL